MTQKKPNEIKEHGNRQSVGGSECLKLIVVLFLLAHSMLACDSFPTC